VPIGGGIRQFLTPTYLYSPEFVTKEIGDFWPPIEKINKYLDNSETGETEDNTGAEDMTKTGST
jgi:hypothetical protein